VRFVKKQRAKSNLFDGSIAQLFIKQRACNDLFEYAVLKIAYEID